MKIKVLSVSLAAERGRKYQAESIKFNLQGVIDDVHAGTPRPVSLIDQSHINAFQRITGSRATEAGEFAENIRVEGLEKANVHAFDRFAGNELLLEVTQIGKPFHDSFQEIGHYVMPRVGVFLRVLKEGELKAGDTLVYQPKTFKAKIITLSDRASKGIYEDRSGKIIAEELKQLFDKTGWRLDIDTHIIPDDRNKLASLLEEARQNNCDLVFTTGGTGIGSRDITLSVVKPLLDHEIPGIMEHIRLKYGSLKPHALLSGGVAGTIGPSIIYTLPGSAKAVTEYMHEIKQSLIHLLYMKSDMDVH